MFESQNIEWKSKWKDEYLEWICGYANAQGGKICIGCDDNGNVVGLPNARKLLEDIPNKIRDTMGIIVGVNLLSVEDKEYIEVDVPSAWRIRNILKLMFRLTRLVSPAKACIIIAVVAQDKY